MTKDSRINDYNYIISLFKKAENNLNNEGWFVKKTWHDLCFAFESYKANITDTNSLDKMILDNVVIQTLSNIYLKIRARKKNTEIADTDDIFYLVAAGKIQMYLGKIKLSSPVIDKIYEDLENYFSDPEFFGCLAEGVLDQVNQNRRSNTDSNIVQTPVKKEGKNKPKKTEKEGTAVGKR